jgi:type II secretory pathway component GspD/PulD (secretin)
MSAMRVNLILILLATPLFSIEEDAKIDSAVQILETPLNLSDFAPPSTPDFITKANPVLLDAKSQAAQDGYTINYNTISIIEYIRFASKICKVNFIYQEADLNFTVTIVSDEPVTAKNVMATLIQILRVHGLLLLEQGNNLVIHKSADVKQIATLVTESSPNANSPIVTRIFRVKNAKPDSVAAIIQPMISSSALLEISAETRQLILTDITANVDKVAVLIENLDSPHTLLDIKSYKTVNNPPDFLINLAGQIMNPIAQGNPFILVPQNLANEIYIVSTPELVQKAMMVFANLDTIPKVKPTAIKTKPEDIFVYKVLHRSGDGVLKSLQNISQNLKSSESSDTDLIQTIESAKWIRDTNSILFIGPVASIEKSKEFLSALDVPVEGGVFNEKNSFFVYKPQYKSPEDVRKSILEMAENLSGTKGADRKLIETIQNSKVNPLTHTLSFSGDEASFPQIKELLSTIDTPSGKPTPTTSIGPQIPLSTQFLIYKPINVKGEQLAASLKEVETQLKSDKLIDPALLNSLATMKWVQSTNSLLFTGDPDSLKKIQTLISTVDIPNSTAKTFFQHHPQYADEGKTENYLKQVTQNLIKKGGSPSLIETLKSYKWIPESHTFMFYGSQEDLDQVKSLLTTFDNPTLAPQVKPGYFIYKVQNTTGDIIEEDLDNLAKNMKSSGIKDTGLIDVITKMRYVKQTNSLLLSGDPKSIEDAKQLIEQYDYSRTKQIATSSNFFMYKPAHIPAHQIEKSLRDIGTNLKSAGLADPNLLTSLDTSKYVESTNTLIFTGDSETLQKIQAMIKDVDIPPDIHAPIQHVGKTTFLLYKLKNAGGPQIVSSIKNMSVELKKSGTADKSFIAALESIKYVKETNSLFFTGNEEALIKVQGLVEQFDVTSLAARPLEKNSTPIAPSSSPGTFYVYKPQYLTGAELESVLLNFSENLKSSGLVDEDLFRTIHSVRWSDKTQTLVFTGPTKSLDQIKELLKEFDVSSNSTAKPKLTTPLEPSIQAIDNTSFLVYKLQFHKGDEIQNALRQIAKDLIITNAPVNQGLLNSINSIQWLEVTNSILCSGDQDTLTRLRELIKNLDIPLKQVFIEMLVIETTLTNALTFGLEWGANYKYRNKFGAGSYNSMPITTGNTPSQFLTNFENLTPPAPPTPFGAQIPVSSGFDLGVIGEVIRHNGETFLTLGSLMSALQTDDEASIIMTPKILTQDGRTSTIFDGRNIPFVGSFVQNNSQTTVNTSNIEYRDIGLSLTVTPVLGNSDIVTLDIDLDRTQAAGDVTGALNFNSLSAQGITTTKTTMKTTVHVPDNNFLILSGMVNNSNAKQKAGIPCLGGLPLIGAAFTKNADTIVNSNIVIFIRPHIINSVDEMRTLSSREEAYFRDQTGTPYLEKNFDEAMELIKTVDDE